MKDVVKYPERQIRQTKGQHGGQVSRYFKTAGRRTLVVVAEVKKTACWLITGYYK